MRSAVLAIVVAALLTACGMQSSPPPIETVVREPIGTTTDAPPPSDGHGYRTPRDQGTPHPPPPPPPLDELRADPPSTAVLPEVQGEKRVERKKAAPKKQTAREVTILPSHTYDPGVLARREVPNIDDVLGQLRQGNIAFSVQQEMFIDELSEVNLVIDTTTTQRELERLVGPGAIGSTLLVSKVIVTKLIAPTFEVTAVTPERQALIDGSPTKWKWLLRPLEQGKHKISLSVTAVLKVDGQSTERFIVTFDRDILVHVTIQNRLSKFWNNNWQWLLSSLLIPLTIWIWNIRRKRRRSQ